MEKDIIEKYKKAGKISVEVKEFAKGLLKEGALLVEIADKIENKIKKLGGLPAFPANLSINEIAAHHVPAYEEKTVLKEGDLIKVDIGVHIDGYIADTAFSHSIGKSDENEKLISAANAALKNALEIIKPGIPVRKIGSVISEKIISAGFQPIRNLTGHSINQFELHSGLNIPNYDNGNENKITEGLVIAIEPFATGGEGLVVEGKSAEVYKLEKEGLTRIGRQIIPYIKNEYSTLPFAKRWLVEKFGLMKTTLALKEALTKGLVKEYKVLREKTGAKVSQAEHTVIVLKEPIIITK